MIISDRNNTRVVIDTAQDAIKLQANKQISFHAKNIIVNAENEISHKGQHVFLEGSKKVQIKTSKDIKLEATDSYQLKAQHSTLASGSKTSVQASQKLETASNAVKMHSGTNTQISSGGQMNLNASVVNVGGSSQAVSGTKATASNVNVEYTESEVDYMDFNGAFVTNAAAQREEQRQQRAEARRNEQEAEQEEVLEKEILSCYATDLDGNEINGYEKNHKILLHLETRNRIGELLRLNLDDAEFDFKYQGNILEDDLLEITIESDYQRIELEVLRQKLNN